MAKEKLLKLAKGGTNKTTTIKKNVVTNVVKPSHTAEDERKLKAKAKVDELLQDINLNPDKKENIITTSSEQSTKQEVVGVEWLEEQLELLTEKNKSLTAELELTKADYFRIYEELRKFKNGTGILDDGDVKTNVVKLFSELQDALFSMGINPTTNTPNLIIYPVAFLNKLIVFFPFLDSYRKY